MVSNTKLFFILCLMVILIGTSLNRRDTRIEALENQLVEVKAELSKTNEDNKKLHAYLTELEASDDIDKKEIMLMWHSIGIMRSNFVALGLGFHLEPEDICPEEVEDCQEGWEEGSGIKDEG